MKQGQRVPQVTFKTRVRDESIGGDNPFRWQDVTTDDIFENKRVVIFSLPGAFTPTCSTFQVPGFEAEYQTIRDLGIDEIYVVSVNDTFVMRRWLIDQNVSTSNSFLMAPANSHGASTCSSTNQTSDLEADHGAMRRSLITV